MISLFLIQHILRVYVLLQLAAVGSSQDCQLSYVTQPPSTISCNIDLTKELNLTCKLKATRSVGDRVKLMWFFTNTDNETLNVRNVTDIYRRIHRITRTRGNQWELTASLSLQNFTFPNHIGQWFCQAMVDGQLVNPSNKLSVRDSDRTGSTNCAGSQFQEVMKCAYPTQSPATSTTTMPSTTPVESTTTESGTTPTTKVTTHVPTIVPTTTTTTITMTSTAQPATTVLQTTPTATEHRTTTLPSSTPDIVFSTIQEVVHSSEPRVLTTVVQVEEDTQTSTFIWIYALSAIVGCFAVILILFVVLFLVLFVTRRKQTKKPVSSPSSYNMANNSAYENPKDLTLVPFSGTLSPSLLHVQEPMYAEIPTIRSESSYIVPDEKPPCFHHKKEESPVGNEYIEHSEYLVLKL